MDTIIKLMRAIMDNNLEAAFKMTNTLDIKMKESEKELKGKDLVRNIFMKWLNAGNTILEMIVTMLPSPRQAQKYRTNHLYEGP